MLSRDRFRQHAPGVQVIPTRPSHANSLVLTALLLLAIAGAYLLAAWGDSKSDVSTAQLAAAERQRLAMKPEVLQAYEAGMADAMEAVQGKPEGVALAQACLAIRKGL